MTVPNESDSRELLHQNRQSHLLHFWNSLDDGQAGQLLRDIANIDFDLMNRIVDQWIHHAPEPEVFHSIEPIPVLPVYDPDEAKAKEASDAGENALRGGKIGIFLVAGGQGTRLGFNGPKGAYPVGPLTGRSLFAYHAEKIQNLQRRYDTTLPWYIMVSDANEKDTLAFFQQNEFFGLQPENVKFVTQQMVPCVDEEGKFILETPYSIAKNPNGHGGAFPAMIEHGVTEDARKRGVTLLTYFQVDNWAVKVADPYFIGCHVLRNANMSSKNHRKREPREPVGVHCLCDGEYRIIEYTELDIYPQLLETDPDGRVVCYAGNSAIHILSVDFVERMYEHYDEFPWHCSHKKIPYIDESGNPVLPQEPNGYKFETFVFDALRFTNHEPVAVEIDFPGEYAPIKQKEGPNSVLEARNSMNEYWAGWLDAAGSSVPTKSDGAPAIQIEISPAFALSREEFVQRSQGRTWPTQTDIAIGPDGTLTPQP